MYTIGGNVEHTVSTPSRSSKMQTKSNGINLSKPSKQVSFDCSVPTTSKYQGWSFDGIKHYIKLYGQVKKAQNSFKCIKYEINF